VPATGHSTTSDGAPRQERRGSGARPAPTLALVERPQGASSTLSQNGHGPPGRTGNGAPEVADRGTDAAGARPGTEVSASEHPDLPRRPPGPSTRPALVVVGIALLVTILGTVASGLVGQPGPAPSQPKVSTAKGSPLKAVSSQRALSSITSGGLPPSDVLEAIALPSGYVVSRGSQTNEGVGLYDRSLGFSVTTSEQKVIEFFRAQLPADLWNVLSKGESGSNGAYRIVAQHPSSDGYEWELGVTIGPETFRSGSAGSSNVGSTPFSLRLFEESDDT